MVQVRNGFDKGDNFFIDKGTGTFITPDSHNITAAQRTWFINSAFNSALNVKENTAEGFRENQATQRLVYQSIVEHQDITDNLKTLGNKVPLRPNKAGETVALDDFITTDNDGNNVLDEDGNQVIIYGLKTLFKNEVKAQAKALLSPSDWYIIRKAEDAGSTIPSNIATYRAAIRTRSNEMETAIDGAADVEAMETLYTYTEAGTRPLGEWPKLS